MGIKPLRAGKRQHRTLLVADGCGLSAWSKLPRRVCRPLRATNGIFDTDKSRWLWPECLVEGVAERLRPLGNADSIADGCGVSAWSKLPRSVLGL